MAMPMTTLPQYKLTRRPSRSRVKTAMRVENLMYSVMHLMRVEIYGRGGRVHTI